MTQKPKKKRKLPKDITERSDHEALEKILGKRVVKKLDEIAKDDPEEASNDNGD
jgi:hypothetical protein